MIPLGILAATPAAAPSGGGLTLTDTRRWEDGKRSSFTANVGAAYPGRQVIVVVTKRVTQTGHTFQSATVNGVPMIRDAHTPTTRYAKVGVFRAPLDTGGTVDIVITHDTGDYGPAEVAVYTIGPSVPTVVAEGATSAQLPAGSIGDYVVGAATGRLSVVAITTTNFPTDFGTNHRIGHGKAAGQNLTADTTQGSVLAVIYA